MKGLQRSTSATNEGITKIHQVFTSAQFCDKAFSDARLERSVLVQAGW
jgi:hypothetical protein